jgi:PAS domain S-box-containing protein
MEDRIWMDAPWPALRVRSAGGQAWAEPNRAARTAPFLAALAPEVVAELARSSLAPDAPAVCQLRAGGTEVRCVHVRLDDGALLWMQPLADAAAAEAADVELASVQLAQARHEAEVLKRGLILAQAAVWRIDLETRRIHFDVLGFEAENFHFDVSGMDLDALRQSIHPDDLAQVTRAADEAMASQRVVDVEARYRDARGQWRTLLTRRVAERDGAGRAIGLAGVSLDVSRQRAEHERAEALAQRTRLVAEVMGVGFWSRDATSDLAHWDEQMYRIHRRDPALGPLGREAWIDQCVHEQDRAWMRARIREADAHWEPLITFTFRAPDAAGDDGQVSQRWIQLWARRVLRDGHRMTYGMHLDVTDRQRAEQLLKQERRRAQLAVNAAGVGVWERDVSGVAVYWNEAMYRMRGLTPDDPRTPDEIMDQTTHPQDRARLQGLFMEHLAGDEPYRHELRVRASDGQWRWLVTHGRALRDENGRLLGVAGVNLDVTERKNAELAWQRAQRLEQASQDKLAFMGRMSHELRTPMNAVLGFTRLLIGDAADPASAGQRERLARIEEAGGRLLALIDDMLETSQTPPPPPPPAMGETGGARTAAIASGADDVAMHVLCVEDNPVNLQLVRELLRLRPSVRLSTAEDGHSGIAQALADPPDLVLLDLQLPDINGTAVMHRLRAEPAMAACRFVALSADAMPQQVQAGLAAGFDDYWTKPIQFDRFLAGIDAMLAARSPAQAQ